MNRPGNILVRRPLAWAGWVLGALLFLLPRGARSAETNRADAPFLFHVGMARICFRDVKPDDATAAYRILLERTGREFGNFVKADTAVFNESSAFEAAIQNQTIHMAVMTPWQFLTMDIHRQMKPFFIVMQNGKVARKILVLTRRDSGLNTLAALRGKDILKLDVANLDTANAWLKVMLLSDKLGTPETFFGRQEIATKPTAAILPVFFGKKPACVVDEASFDLMKELNPQVGQQLQAVAVSDPLANVVLCLSEDGWRSVQEKNNAIRSMSDLHLNPVGQQTCTLFKIDRMMPFEDAQLDPIRKLQAALAALQIADSPSNRPAAALLLLGQNGLTPPGQAWPTKKDE